MLSFKIRFALIVFLAFSLPAFSQLNLQVYMDEARKELNEKNYFDAIQKLDVCIEVKPIVPRLQNNFQAKVKSIYS